ncbi:MAG: B12-binding domain-containing radical SAM protein [Planctomycetes bacterium]|nr:B12-binding domain-containing radical SAM protein [Planctomycetota bacterium]
MKFLFLIPPENYFPQRYPDRLYGCSYSYDYKPPVHLLLAATIARDAGIEVALIDSIAEKLDSAELHEMIADHQPVGAYCFFTPYVAQVGDLKLKAELRAKYGNDPMMIFMGAAPTWKPEEFIESERDVVLRGEFEASMKSLAENRLDVDYASMQGVTFMDRGELRSTDRGEFLDIEALPYPDRSLLNGFYQVNRLNVHPVTAAVFSRGCAYSCKFCAPMALDQAIELEYKKEQSWYDKRPPLRLRTARQVIAEFEHIAKLGYKGVEVADNVFNWNKKRTLEICEGIKPLGLEWLCLNRSPQMQDMEVLQAMKDAGCKLVYMGTESFDQGILDAADKRQPVGSIKDAVDNLNAVGIEPEISVLVGASHEETRETAEKSVEEALKLNTRFMHIGAFTPFPNTEYYDLAKKNGWLKSGDYSPADMIMKPQIDLPGLSGEEMYEISHKAIRRQYLRPKAIWRHFLKVRSLRDFGHKSKMFVKFLLHMK